eukprot:COSAG04_NODE_20765_length_387_cov_0.565972_2_plen_43_part_01
MNSRAMAAPLIRGVPVFCSISPPPTTNRISTMQMYGWYWRSSP